MPRGSIMSENNTASTPKGIPSISYSIEEGEKGFLLNFPIDQSRLKKRDAYIVSFDIPVSLPKNPPNTILFEPSSASYTIYGENNFTPKIFVKIKALHRAQTKTLIRLTIKDISDTILYLDYIMVICSPQSAFKFEGSLLPSNISGNIGASGGSLLRLDATNTSVLTVGMTVTGPGIPENKRLSILRIVDNSTVELNQLISTNQNYAGVYTFVQSTDCVDPSSLSIREIQPSYTILDYSNNWTYKVSDKVIAQFVVSDQLYNLDTIVFLPIKNSSLLNSSDLPANIPTISVIKAAGRINSDTYCISEVSFD